MRINKYLAYRYGCSRRGADQAIERGEVFVNSQPASVGQEISAEQDTIIWPGHTPIKKQGTTIKLHKPTGYVSSHEGQGSKTIYDLLPPEYQHLKIAGRLDKDSSGLMILSDDGNLIQELSHPSNNKIKVYRVTLHKELQDADIKKLMIGVDIGDQQPSRMSVNKQEKRYVVSLEEGRNRQIRRSFSALGYEVRTLHRTQIDKTHLDDLASGEYKIM